MMLTLETIPEEPGFEAQELEKLSIRELQLRLSAEMVKLPEVQPEQGGSLVVHKSVVRGCTTEPTGFGRGRQSPFSQSYDHGGKPDGYGLTAPGGDWMLLARKAMKKSVALTEHWNVALGEWEDDAVAEPSCTSGGGATEVEGYRCLEYKVDREAVPEPQSTALPTNRGEEFESMASAARGNNLDAGQEERDSHQADDRQLLRTADVATSAGDSSFEFYGDGQCFDHKSGEPRGRGWTGADIPDLLAGDSSETCGGNAVVDDRAGSRASEGVSSLADREIPGSCLHEGLERTTAHIQHDDGGQCNTFLGIPRRHLVVSSKADSWEPSTLGHDRDSSSMSVELLANVGPHTALLLVEEGLVPLANEPHLSEGVRASILPVSVVRQDLEGEEWQNDGQKVQEEGSRSGLEDHDIHKGDRPLEEPHLLSVVVLDNHPFLEHVVELGFCNAAETATAEKAGPNPTTSMTFAVVPSQELKDDNPSLAGEGSVCLPCDEWVGLTQSSRQEEASKPDQDATADLRVQAFGEVLTAALQNCSSEDPGSGFGGSGLSKPDSLSWDPRGEGYMVPETAYSVNGDPSPGKDSDHLNRGGRSPATDRDQFNSTSPADIQGLLTGACARAILPSSGSWDGGVRQVADRWTPGKEDDAKEIAGITIDSPVQLMTATEATYGTELTVDSCVSPVSGFQVDPRIDSRVWDAPLLDLNNPGYKNNPGFTNPGEYTTLLEKMESKLRPPVTKEDSSQNNESLNGEPLGGGDDEGMPQKKLPPYPRSPLLDLQDRVSFGAIGYTASDLRSDTTQELGEVTGLVDGLLSDSLEIRCLAAEKIRTLTKYNAKARTRMGQLDATDRSGKHSLIPALVAVLHSTVHQYHVDHPPPTLRKAQEMAACAILNLGINNDQNKAAIVAAGAVPELVELLRGNVGVRTKEAAIAALLTLSCLQENHSHMGSTRGTISQLVHVLRRGTKQACKDALTALNNLTASMGNRQRMVRAGAVRALTRLLATGDYGESPLPDAPHIQDAIIGEKCVALLFNLSSTKDGREAILNTNGTLAVLCEILDSEFSTDREKEHAASTLWNICSNSVYHSQLVKDEGVTPALISLSVEGSLRAQEKARLLLAHLSSTCDHRDEPGSARIRTTSSFQRQMELVLADDGYFASESEKSVENYSSASESLCSTPASQPLRIQWTGPPMHHSAPLEPVSNHPRDCKVKSGTRRSVLANLLRHINPLARHHRSASSFVPFGRKS